MFHSEPGWQYCRVHTCFVSTHISLPTSNLWTTIRNHSWGNNMVILLFIYLANNNNYDNSWLWWYLCHDSFWSMCLYHSCDLGRFLNLIDHCVSQPNFQSQLKWIKGFESFIENKKCSHLNHYFYEIPPCKKTIQYWLSSVDYWSHKWWTDWAACWSNRYHELWERHVSSAVLIQNFE